VWDDWDDCHPKTYESTFIHHDFVQFGKQHSRYKAILSSIVFAQQCCEVGYAAPDLDGGEPGAQAWWEAPCADIKCLGRG